MKIRKDDKVVVLSGRDKGKEGKVLSADPKNGKVIVDLIGFDSQTNFTYAYYRTSAGNEANYDITPGTSGWGPDYGDAQTFLDTIQPYGYMTKNIGLY